jgi:hypothetical protein
MDYLSKACALIFCCLILLLSASAQISQVPGLPAPAPAGPTQTILAGDLQVDHQGTIFLFRRHYAPGNKPSVILDGKRIARMQSGSYFSIRVSPGTHRLQSTLDPNGEMTDVEVLAEKTVYLEMTFADVPHQQSSTLTHGHWLKTPLFTPTPGSIARDRFPKLKPLDRKWAFDDRVVVTAPDFP